MYKINIISMTVASLFVISNAFADGLSHDVDELQVTAEALVSAVNANTAAISVNASGISSNASAVNANSADIAENGTAISSNTAAINAVAAQVATIPTPVTYDYKNYTSNVSSKTFRLQMAPGLCGDTETRTFTRVVNGDVTDLKINRIRTLYGNVCQNKSFNYVLTPTTKKLVSKENNTLAGNLKSTDILGKPFTLEKSTMVEGISFGGATGIKNQLVGGTPILISAFVNTVTVERVQVKVVSPSNTYTGEFHPVKESFLSVDEAGRIKELFKQEGDFAKKGALLAQVTNPSLEGKLEIAKATIKELHRRKTQ